MNGYIGERARKRKRKFYVLFFLIILVVLSIYFSPSFQVNEIRLSKQLIPSEEEINIPQITNTIEDLELTIFDKEQKIIFRNNQIDELKLELNSLVKENKILSTDNVELKNQISKSNSQEDLILKNKIITEKKVKELNNINSKFTEEKKILKLEIDNIKIKNNSLTKELKSYMSKSLKINNIKNDLENKINILQDTIEEQNLIIKILKDKSPHG